MFHPERSRGMGNQQDNKLQVIHSSTPLSMRVSFHALSLKTSDRNPVFINFRNHSGLTNIDVQSTEDSCFNISTFPSLNTQYKNCRIFHQDSTLLILSQYFV